MHRFRQKNKSDKPMKYFDKEKPLFIPDVKLVKERLKIKEIFGNVKINNSMRLKAPPGRKVLQANDFSDDWGDFEEVTNLSSGNLPEPPCAMNSAMFVETECQNENEVNSDSENYLNNNEEEAIDSKYVDPDTACEIDRGESSGNTANAESTEESDEHFTNTPELTEIKKTLPMVNENQNIKLGRERKFSLDHTMLNRREEISLQRKSSFFKKKFDSFIRNTTDLFHKQSIGSKSQTINRRDSKSISLQSLNEKSTDGRQVCSAETLYDGQGGLRDSMSSLHSSSTLGYSRSSTGTPLPDPNFELESLTGSQPTLSVSEPLDNVTSASIQNLNKGANQAQTLLNSRAISMGSGLDCTNGHRKQKTTSYKRRSWFGNERNNEIQEYHSYQDFGSIPENTSVADLNTKQRRLSYQRAVSGEDPVYHLRYQDTIKKKHKTENHELAYRLTEFGRNGIPPLKNFLIDRNREVFVHFKWVEDEIETFYDWKQLGSKEEESRQAVIRELVTTEADYLKHLLYIVDVCIATAHALQENNLLLFLQTDTLFSNLPDVLLRGFDFFEVTFCPMIDDAIQNNSPFNTDLMYSGFNRFREFFYPYERYLNDQQRLSDYLRALNSYSDFQVYSNWCQSHESSNRLSFTDILIKPMQRLTKYGLLLQRIAQHTTNEPERTLLLAMESSAKNHVLDLNRSVRQRQEVKRLEELHSSMDVYEIDFRDDDMDVMFRAHIETNLKEPMPNCLPCQSRMVIHEADMRFKDHAKEVDARVILLTDMLLVCKRLPKNNQNLLYKLIRPKFMIDRLMLMPKYNPRNPKEYTALVILITDTVGSSCHCFTLSEISSKEPNPQASLRLWELKIKEAKLTYNYSMRLARSLSRDVSDIELNSSSDCADSDSKQKLSSEDLQLERDARERVAAMLHMHRSFGASTDYDFSQSMNTDSFDGEASGASNVRCSCHKSLKTASTGGSSRNSRLSSFQQSTSAASHDEPQPGPSRIIYRAGSSVEHVIPPLNPDDGVTSITVNVLSESESETMVPASQTVTPLSAPPPVVFPPPHPHGYKARSPMPSCSHTLRVQPQAGAMALVHSLPDLSIHAAHHAYSTRGQSSEPQSASSRLYQSHQEGLQQRNKLTAGHQYLSPDNRGTSYPPPSPTRPLKRGLAFSYSFKNPPLTKMGHVNSQSQLQAETTIQSKNERSFPSSAPVPGTSGNKTDRSDKKQKSVSSRHKSGRRSLSPAEKVSTED